MTYSVNNINELTRKVINSCGFFVAQLSLNHQRDNCFMNFTHEVLGELAKAIADKIRGEFVVTRWLTIEEAMKYAKVKSRTTMLEWIKLGHIYAFKRTGEWIIDRDSIDAFYNTGRNWRKKTFRR